MTAAKQDDGRHSGSAVSVVAVSCGILLAGRLSLETLMWMGCISISRKTALTLAALASLSYVICGPVLKKTPLTNRLGHLLVERVLNARQNWELDTLRSFCEVSIWLLVVWSTYVGTDGGCFGLVAALTLGTAAGAALVVLGELLQQPLRNLERALKESSTGRHMKGHLEEETFVRGNIVLLVLFGPSALGTIYENCSDLMVLASILVLGGATILVAARLCQAWTPTRHLGTILQARILNTWENWRTQPARSALESTFFTAVVMGVYELHGDPLFALQTGFLSGMSIVIANEVFAHGINFDIKADSRTEDMSVRPVILGYVSFMMLVCVYAQGHQAVNSAALSVIINSLLWVMIGRFSMTTGIFRELGTVINKRALEASENWTKYPVRSAGECSAWLCGQYVGYCLDSTLAGALLGTAAGVSAVLCSEAVHALYREPSSGKVKGSAGSAESRWTWEEVERHSTADDAWLVIDGRVYDVTDFAVSHPGGPIIYKFAGVDASDQFAAFHRPRVYGRLPQFLVGEVIEDEGHLPSKATADYRALRKRLWREGWFKADPNFYVGKAALCVALFTLAIGMATSLPSAWSFSRTVLAGAVLGMAWQQIAFMAHDADHYGITTPRSGSSFNPLAWLLASCFFGISRCMWNEEHSLHHAITLRPQEDPQFNYLPLWLISKKELDVPGTRVDFLTRCLVSVQHFTFLPVSVVIGRFNFYLISFLSALKRLVFAARSREALGGFADVTGMLLFWTWYVALVSQFETSRERLSFVLASNWTVGILHIQLVLSHLATDTFTAEEEREQQFFTFQLKTSRNIDSDWYDHWFHGGLEFQIEHHLFPQLPRHNLEKVKPLVKEICERHGIEYQSTSFSNAVSVVLKDFRGLAMDIANLRMG